MDPQQQHHERGDAGSGSGHDDSSNVVARSSRPPLPPLALVTCGLLRADTRLVPLRHVAALFAHFLDVSLIVSLPKAAAMGSIRLFDRVVARFTADASLDRPQRDFWFARAMVAALEQDDLVMLQRIHALHPEPLFVHAPSVPNVLYTNALGLAFKYGTLETVQWLVDNRADRACCAPGVRSFCRACLRDAVRGAGDRDAFRIAMWLWDGGFVNMVNQRRVEDTLKFLLYTSPTLIQWLDARKLLAEQTARTQLYYAIRNCRADNAMVLLDVLPVPMETAFAQECLLRASFGGLDDVAEKLIACGHCQAFQHKFQLAPTTPGGKPLVQWGAAFIKKKIRKGDSSWLFREQGVRPKAWTLDFHAPDDVTLLAICTWMQSVRMRFSPSLLDAAAGKGFLDTVQWLHTHATIGCSTAAMDNAAGNGFLEIVQWLHTHRSEGCTAEAMTSAAGNSHLHVVQWLYQHRREGANHKEAMGHAAHYGHLHVLVWLARVSPQDYCTACLLDFVFNRILVYLRGCMNIDVVRWIDAQPTVLCASCRVNGMRASGAMIRAAKSGDLELCNYLHDVHRADMFFSDPVDAARLAAQNGHLAALQWIHAHFGVVDVNEQDAEDARGWHDDWREYVIEEATEFGHDHILAWVRSLDENL